MVRFYWSSLISYIYLHEIDSKELLKTQVCPSHINFDSRRLAQGTHCPAGFCSIIGVDKKSPSLEGILSLQTSILSSFVTCLPLLVFLMRETEKVVDLVLSLQGAEKIFEQLIFSSLDQVGM
jgi:hypothetical protein